MASTSIPSNVHSVGGRAVGTASATPFVVHFVIVEPDELRFESLAEVVAGRRVYRGHVGHAAAFVCSVPARAAALFAV